jgi:cation transport ATPase
MLAKSIFALNRPLTSLEMSGRRRSLVRLGLAWLAMMQVMMFALPGYLRVEAGPNDSLEVLNWAIFLMNWASLALTVPVLTYAAWPVWQGVVRAFFERRITMDIPVATSMVAAFIPSVTATISGHGEVYFDSVTMFIAFLLTARYFEIRAKQSVDAAQGGAQLDACCRPLIDQSDRVATVFIFAQLGCALLIFLYWSQTQPEHALSVLVALLVMSCPCALALAAPMSFAAMHASLAAYPTMSEAQRHALFVRTRCVTRQNLYGSLVWHVLTMPLAAMGWVTPWLAALFMLVSSAAVVGNAWRLYSIPADALSVAGSKGLSPQTQV